MIRSEGLGRIGTIKVEDVKVNVKDANGVTTQELRKLTTLTVACEHANSRKDDQGKRIPDWLTVKCWNGLGETVGNLFEKGDVIRVWGHMTSNVVTKNVQQEVECPQCHVKLTVTIPVKTTYWELAAEGFAFVPGTLTKKQQAKQEGTANGTATVAVSTGTNNGNVVVASVSTPAVEVPTGDNDEQAPF